MKKRSSALALGLLTPLAREAQQELTRLPAVRGGRRGQREHLPRAGGGARKDGPRAARRCPPGRARAANMPYTRAHR